MFPVGIGLRDPRSQTRDLGHPSVSPFDYAKGTSFVISLPTRLSESSAPDDKGRARFRAEKMRTDEKLKMIPVMVLIPFQEERSMVASYKLGVKSYVVKPLNACHPIILSSDLGRRSAYPCGRPPSIARSRPRRLWSARNCHKSCLRSKRATVFWHR